MINIPGIWKKGAIDTLNNHEWDDAWNEHLKNKEEQRKPNSGDDESSDETQLAQQKKKQQENPSLLWKRGAHFTAKRKKIGVPTRQ